MTQRFTVKKQLTNMVNMNGWVIYRDSENGLYAFNKETEQDVNLLRWNLTMSDPKIAFAIEDIRELIKKAEENN